MMSSKIKGGAREAWAGGVGLAIAIVVTWAVTQFGGIEVPQEVTAAFGGIVVWVLHKVDEVTQ